jgi:hypothetical protein
MAHVSGEVRVDPLITPHASALAGARITRQVDAAVAHAPPASRSG